MKAYLITTGILFGLLGLAHFLRTFLEWRRLSTEPSFILEGPGIGLVGAALSMWAWRVLWTLRTVRPPDGDRSRG